MTAARKSSAARRASTCDTHPPGSERNTGINGKINGEKLSVKTALVHAIRAELREWFADWRASGATLLEHEESHIIGGIILRVTQDDLEKSEK